MRLIVEFSTLLRVLLLTYTCPMRRHRLVPDAEPVPHPIYGGADWPWFRWDGSFYRTCWCGRRTERVL